MSYAMTRVLLSHMCARVRMRVWACVGWRDRDLYISCRICVKGVNSNPNVLKVNVFPLIAFGHGGSP
jgi:hypothetical protein